MEKFRSAMACNVINVILGAFLFFCPWLFSFAHGAESWNAWIAGIVIAALSIAALAAFAEWEEWLNLVVGLWVIVSPWALHFYANVTPMRVTAIVGVIVALVAAIEIWLTHRTPPRVTVQ